MINYDKARLALDEIQPGLTKYNSIMELLHQVDVSKDESFQKLYNGFYRMRQRKPEFYQGYYDFMEAKKTDAISFEETLEHFYEKFSRIESSFSSKLVATINPNKPVWDKYVMENLDIKVPSYSSNDRLQKTIEAYTKLEEWYDSFLGSSSAKEVLELFDSRFPDTNLTEVKKIDLILWKIR
ncbi:hypothetical protein J0B03_05690 [Alkalibacter rhizosphaerae]|uniref:Uncharacterized protein n=1 Tax=Alkalibacter rhizosphaerae TaxID=2815577 RepID=A0A974XGQ1_9FIRM|nr:hypothetical protein [Alkalibacter rhizosphaerae]QSX09554.1 hypothetical protein J0B03_05690 [Alkalibacter rhizosphaerae]